MLVQTVASPSTAILRATRPPGLRRRSDKMLVSRMWRNISKIHVLDRLEVVDGRKLLVERNPCGQELQERRSRHRLDDEPISLLPQQGLAAGKLEVARNAQRLVAPISEQPYLAFGRHDILLASRPMLRHMLAQGSRLRPPADGGCFR